jgi:amidase
MPDALWRLDAVAQAALVRAGEVSALELVDAAIGRIESLNPRVNAVITPLYERAREQARGPIDRRAPFAGVPLLVKDACLEIEGTPYYLGTRVLRDAGYRSPRTTELARRFEHAGLIVLGKTNVPELSSGITTEPSAFGPTRNPWDLERSAGGSSGGSAAAVACGMVSVAHGGDATGSLRYPAACCGVATLKPSRGRMPHETPAAQPDPAGVWTQFVLARSVRDLAAVLDATHGPGRGGPWHAPAPVRAYAGELRPPAQPLRVGLLPRDVQSGLPVHAECVAAVERTGAALASMGHGVEESHPAALERLYMRPGGGFAEAITVARYAQLRWLARAIGRELTQDDLDTPLVSEPRANAVSALAYADAASALDRAARSMHAWWEDEGHDLLVTPTLRQPPWPLGSNGGAVDAGTFPGPFSFSGQPAMSLPLHWTAEGLPAGVQLVAAYGREDVLFNVASQLEEAMPWGERWPALAHVA